MNLHIKTLTTGILALVLGASCKDKPKADQKDVASTAPASTTASAATPPAPKARSNPKPTPSAASESNPACRTIKLGPSNLGPFTVVSSVGDDEEGTQCTVILEATEPIRLLRFKALFKDKDGVKLGESGARLERLEKGDKQKEVLSLNDDTATIEFVKD